MLKYIFLAWILTACNTECECELPPAHAYARPDIPCDATLPDGTIVDGVEVGTCRPRCNETGPVCNFGVYSTFVTVDEDTCAVGHVCYCEIPVATP